MAEEMGDKTEAPTPRRRQEAHDQGNFARSPDLVASALLVSILLLLRSFGAGIVAAMRSVLEEFLGRSSLSDVTGALLQPVMVRSVVAIGLAMMPLMIGVILVAIILNLLQTGFYLNLSKLQPNLMALNPLKGLGRIFSLRGPGAMQLVMNLVKLLLVSFTAYSAVSGRLGTIINVQQLSFIQIFGLGADVIFSITLRIGVLLLILALLDYAYQKFRIERELRMSKEEIKEEMKRMEGDPRVKNRRRQVAIQRARERLKKTVPTADVVVTNPTHFAVALKYDAKSMHAPRVVAKGQDLLARRIRELAGEHGIPVIERAPLARAIYRMCDIGDEIPEQFYSAIAEILAYVYELNGKMMKRKIAV